MVRSNMTRILLASAALSLSGPALAQDAASGLPAASDPVVFGDAARASDALFAQPYIDKDEWRDAPVRHRYVHGGFKGTDLKFSFYMPPKEQFGFRFFQYVTPVPDNENLAQTNGLGQIGSTLEAGGYFVETNGGGSGATAGPAFMADPAIGGYRANAAAAEFSRRLAYQMYGPGKVYGYVYGGSGGAYRTLGGIENTTTWDGAVPFVAGTPMASPNNFSIRMHAMRLLWNKFPQIVDAMDAGGNGDPYKGLTRDEADALREATRMGFPPQSWFGWKTMGVHGFTAVYQGMVMADPTYFEDFWTKPGYLGFNPPESLKKARLQFPTKIRLALDEDAAVAKGFTDVRIPGTARGTAELAWQNAVGGGGKRPVAFALEGTPPDVGFMGGDMYVLSGEAKGARIALRALKGDAVTLGVVDLKTVAKLKAGDEVRIDNSNFLAAQTYHRHQVPDASYTNYDQFRGSDGKPLYPQRKMLLGPMFARGAAGAVPTGHFNGRIIMVESGLDREAVPNQADWYARKFNEFYGKEAPNKYRLWFTENALHGATEAAGAPTRVINYMPMLQQALRDVSAWVEKGVQPPANTAYKMVDGQVVLALDAATRGGVQPLVTLAANGGAKAVVRRGQAVKFTGFIAVPGNVGSVVGAEWDFDGSGQFADKAELPVVPDARSATVSTSHSFAKPGTYFVTLRAFVQRNGDAKTPYARLPNLARVRVVVR